MTSDTMDLDDGPRGVKRKADDSQLISQDPKRIKALDQNVVNKIAAGEIIVAPMHALKELIENAVDARSTSLEITVKDGGLKLLQITDNGHGIHKDDLPILCERFTTSKLKKFEDLASIGTYGFRGEALASISHIAHLTITTRTADSSCAFRAKYADGKMVPAKPGQSAEARSAPGRKGTQITVEDLFYNIPQRQKAFKSPSEEYAKILDVVGRYAVHCEGVAFSCKKHGDSSMSIAVAADTSTADRIRQVYGSKVASELISFQVSDKRWGFKASGLASNANYHAKKTTILLFINHRAVESSVVRSAVQRTYSAFLPKGGHPFVYLSLDIDPQRVDVNVHPTKREVNFLNEDEIVELVCENIRNELSKVDTSRTFMTQSLLSSTKAPATPALKSNTRPAENNLIRTDPSLRKITSMLPSTSAVDPSDQILASEPGYSFIDQPHTQIRLASVRDLRASVRSAMHGGLSEIFAAHTYVGLVDSARRISAIQSGVKLYLVDYGMVCNEYFYQIGLTDFGNFGTIIFDTPLDVKAIIEIAVSQECANNDTGDLSRVSDLVMKKLVEKRELLLEYFNVDVTADGQLKGLPLLMKGYMPSLAKLPQFLMRLGPCVDWEDEMECFRTFLTELASFHVPEQLPNPEQRGSDGAGSADSEEVREAVPDEGFAAERVRLEQTLEHVLFPAFRARLVATKGLLKGVVEVANLKGLYRVFERC